MMKVMVDPATLERLRGVNEPLELCDGSGRVLGVFTPGAYSPPCGTTPQTLRARKAEAAPGTEAELSVYGRVEDLE